MRGICFLALPMADRHETRKVPRPRHFDQATDDVRQIRISTDKVTKRGERITDLQLEDEDGAAAVEAEDLAPPLVARIGEN